LLLFWFIIKIICKFCDLVTDDYIFAFAFANKKPGLDSIPVKQEWLTPASFTSHRKQKMFLLGMECPKFVHRMFASQ
jgi:hypothetical protein